MASLHPVQASLSGLFISTLVAGALLGACASSTPPPESAGAESPAAKETEADSSTKSGDSTPMAFDDMSAGQKLEHMKTVVMPRMAKVFSESPDEEEAEFSCKNCHGAGAATGNFSMPNAELPKLSEELTQAHPEATKFMKERVVPEMQALLGDENFGCTGCHEKAD